MASENERECNFINKRAKLRLPTFLPKFGDFGFFCLRASKNEWKSNFKTWESKARDSSLRKKILGILVVVLI